MSRLHFHYDFVPSAVLDAPNAAERIAWMKAAGVETVWLDAYAYGTWLASKQELLHAKQLLEGHGFEVQALTIPVGHGTGALLGDGADPELPSTWKNRINAQGNPIALAACFHQEQMIQESREVAMTLYELGFTKLFYDDDLRAGPWGPSLQGCFCPQCMQSFYQKYPQYSGMSGADILAMATEGDMLWQAWSDVQCDHVLYFLEQTLPQGMTPGIMVMHNGDSRHGIDIARIKAKFPQALFRVGEGHFEDSSFTHPLAEDAIRHSITTHLTQIGNVQNAFSESTVYPENALTAAHLIQKLQLEVMCGLRNLFLMSGLFFLDKEYWQAIVEARPLLEALAQNVPASDLSQPCEPFIWQL